MQESQESYVAVARTFRDLSDAEMADIEKASLLMKAGWGGFGWDEVLRSQRVLLISEAGAGKTRECKAQRDRLLAAGEPAFFFELGTLATTPLSDMLRPEEESLFDAWRASPSGIATFFLDSIDELKLTLGSFEVALIRFAKAMGGQLARARIVVTTRPVPFDQALIARHLPIPPPLEAAATAEAFADRVMERGGGKSSAGGKDAKAWRSVGLMPLSQEQRRDFAVARGVPDPDALLDDIQRRDAEEFAGRPQDLIELCADWCDHQHIRSHRDQVATDIAVKLKPRTDRQERAALTQDSALDAASRLALAAMLTRKLTLRHSAESDRVAAREPALDVSKTLLDFGADAQATLLERPLFGFASYGRVRFHHRSVVEFLAAKRLDTLLQRGAPIKAIKRLLFAETAQGVPVVRPSMRPVAAWLSAMRETVFDDVVRLDPAVVLDHGDPQALSGAQRTRALEAYVASHGTGGWRGLRTPSIQVHRFASDELAGPVTRLWAGGIENCEVRELLLRLIAVGKLGACADLAYGAAMENGAPNHERILAIEALIRLGDPRVAAISKSVEDDPAHWPPAMARRAMLELIPAHMPVGRLVAIVRRTPDSRESLGDYTYRLRQEIANGVVEPAYLDALRQALADLVSGGLTWNDDKYPHLRTVRPDLLPALTAACHRQAVEGVRTAGWTQASLLALRLSKRDYGEEKPLDRLRRALDDLPPEAREAAFWHEAALLEGLRPMKDAYGRLFELTHNKGIALDDAKDAAWVRRRLADPNVPAGHREMMLWAEMVFLHRDLPDRRGLLEDLRPLVADAPPLAAIIEARLAPREEDAELLRMQARSAKRVALEERRREKAHASWVTFWQEVARDPEAVFHPDRAGNTAWNLWQSVERSGEESRASGWDRRRIEHEFGKPVADRLRQTMMAAWRKDTPTLASERPAGERNSFLVRWQFGLAGVAAEAEDPNWARRLTEAEAELACRYAPMQLNGFPPWLERLAVEHPVPVDRVLGEELSRSLRDAVNGGGYVMALQDVSYASAIVAALFVPRIRAWLEALHPEEVPTDSVQTVAQHLRQAIAILIASGTDDDRRFVAAEAARRLADSNVLLADMWCPALLRLDPTAGVTHLERRLEGAEIAKLGPGVLLFAALFDRDLGISVDVSGFPPPLLLRLLRLAYRHVRTADDERHEGSYSPGMRDHAERARNAVLSAVLAAPGPEGWEAKLAMASDPLFAHQKDRTLMLAAEKAAEEADGAPLTEGEFVILDKSGEVPPATRDAMFALLRDRLDDLDDLLLQDVSPREAWAGIGDERVMRRELARALREAAKGSYTVDQEAVTADEKETDIRLRSTVSSQQATIELKLADDRSGRDLFDTLRDQLLTKYMAADDCRAGCLLVTNAKDKKWEHPVTGARIGFEELMRVLNDEAGEISRKMEGTVKLMAKGLDLRPRLDRS